MQDNALPFSSDAVVVKLIRGRYACMKRDALFIREPYIPEQYLVLRTIREAPSSCVGRLVVTPISHMGNRRTWDVEDAILK